MPLDVAADDVGMHVYLQRLGQRQLGDVTAEDVLRLMAERKFAVDEDVELRVADALDAWRAGRCEDRRVVVAEGVPVVHGRRGSIEWAPGCNPDRKPPEETEDFSHYASCLINVEAGGLIATITPATEGTPGRDVYGVEIPARAGAPVEYKPGEGCHLEPDSGSVIADVSGLLSVEDAEIRVSQGLHIRGNVDFNTGHIQSPGDVTVEGQVADLFSLTSERTVAIRGDVMAADVRARGSITIGGALTNHRKGICLSGGDLNIRLTDNSIAAARGSIIIVREAINSDLFAGMALRCENGSINGGQAVALGGVTAKVLGSPSAGAKLVVVVGVDWMLPRLVAPLTAEIQQCEKTLQERKPALDLLRANLKRLTPQQREQVTEMEFDLQSLEMERDEKLQAIQAMRETSEANGKTEITVSKAIHPGVELRLGNRVVKIDRELKGPVTLSVVEMLGEKMIMVAGPGGNKDTLRSGKLADPLAGVTLPPIPPEPA